MVYIKCTGAHQKCRYILITPPTLGMQRVLRKHPEICCLNDIVSTVRKRT